MSLIGSLLMILTGLVIMSFGLFIFYAWLPLLYAIVGLDIGLMLGRWLTGDVGAIAIVLGIAGAVLLGAASYFLEPYRRLLLGASVGVLFGLSLATAFNLDTVLGAVLARILVLLCGVLGAAFVVRFFNAFVVGASAISGATMAVAGAHHLLPSLGLFDLASGDVLPRALTLLLAVLGVIWQAQNIGKWAEMLPVNDRGPAA
ncbi:MAG: hypothetical protein JNL45_08450 [Hyphomicrobium sp.]|nr:hypothetical protein [Hyphomicrobium sp.]